MNVLLAIAGVLGELQQRGPETVGEQNEQVDGQILHGRWGSPDPVNAIIGHDLFRSHAPLHHTNEPVSVRLILRRAAGPRQFDALMTDILTMTSSKLSRDLLWCDYYFLGHEEGPTEAQQVSHEELLMPLVGGEPVRRRCWPFRRTVANNPKCQALTLFASASTGRSA